MWCWPRRGTIADTAIARYLHFWLTFLPTLDSPRSISENHQTHGAFVFLYFTDFCDVCGRPVTLFPELSKCTLLIFS